MSRLVEYVFFLTRSALPCIPLINNAINKYTMKEIKAIPTQSQMSNLVGMFAFKLDSNRKITRKVYILGKADNEHFICQYISPLDGVPNIARLLTIAELKHWVIIPTMQIAEEVLEDYHKDRCFRYVDAKI